MRTYRIWTSIEIPKTTKRAGIAHLNRSCDTMPLLITKYEIIERITVVIRTLTIRLCVKSSMKERSGVRLMKMSYDYFLKDRLLKTQMYYYTIG
ncbi:MAG TPA: hypothetical protein VFJ23_06900 [Candidatus Nitrosotalea sp.]|nr:hypothetical protein [Candidatus Nitrosotalea sp.]